MSTYARYLIAGPMTLAPQARAAALAWDASAGTMYQQPSLYVLGADPTAATHTCSYGLIDVAYAPAIQAAIAADFPGWQMIQNDDPDAPGWQMIQNDDPDAALTQAGLGRVIVPTMP